MRSLNATFGMSRPEPSRLAKELLVETKHHRAEWEWRLAVKIWFMSGIGTWVRLRVGLCFLQLVARELSQELTHLNRPHVQTPPKFSILSWTLCGGVEPLVALGWSASLAVTFFGDFVCFDLPPPPEKPWIYEKQPRKYGEKGGWRYQGKDIVARGDTQYRVERHAGSSCSHGTSYQ